jgi:ParB/RepB/Spo0J family partition protein
MKRNYRVQKWNITNLKEHPRQRELIGNIPEHELAAIAASMKKDGLDHPIEILSDGTIIAGHQRVLAAKMLGWTEIDAIVRKDLEEKGPAAVVAYLIGDNLFRRQLSGLARARGIQELIKLQERYMTDKSRERMKAEIGKQLGGIDVREVNRYLRVLQAPTEVQQAFDLGKISLDKAGKVASLSDRQKKEIIARINSGENPKTVVGAYTAAKNGRHKHATAAFKILVTRLEAALADMEDRLDKVYRVEINKNKSLLERARRLLTGLLREGKKQCASASDLAALADSLASQGNGMQEYFGIEE